MRIDNSRAKAFFTCPAFYQERYLYNIEPAERSEALSFGTRMHQLLEERHRRMMGEQPEPFPPLDSEALEAEAQAMFAGYEAHYPEEPFEVVGVEQFFEVGLPMTVTGVPAICLDCSNSCGWGASFDARYPVDVVVCPECGAPTKRWFHHTYIGEFDAIVRMRDSGGLALLETKTERRGNKANLPEAWAARSQASLYLWAAEQLYGEPFERVILNVLTRQSPAGREPASFRRDTNIQRSEQEKLDAVNNIIWVADQIEALGRGRGTDGLWPQNRNACVNEITGWRCPYYKLHIHGRDEITLRNFVPAEEYLAL